MAAVEKTTGSPASTTRPRSGSVAMQPSVLPPQPPLPSSASLTFPRNQRPPTSPSSGALATPYSSNPMSAPGLAGLFTPSLERSPSPEAKTPLARAQHELALSDVEALVLEGAETPKAVDWSVGRTAGLQGLDTVSNGYFPTFLPAPPIASPPAPKRPVPSAPPMLERSHSSLPSSAPTSHPRASHIALLMSFGSNMSPPPSMGAGPSGTAMVSGGGGSSMGSLGGGGAPMTRSWSTPVPTQREFEVLERKRSLGHSSAPNRNKENARPGPSAHLSFTSLNSPSYLAGPGTSSSSSPGMTESGSPRPGFARFASSPSVPLSPTTTTRRPSAQEMLGPGKAAFAMTAMAAGGGGD